MKTMKKFIALVIVGAICAALAACNSAKQTTADSSADEGNSANETAATQDTPAANGKLVMATNASFPPYEFYENEKIVGIDAEIAELIAGKLGKELEIKDMEFGSIIGAVQTGSVDIGMAGMSVTEERLVTVDFSDTYATAVQAIIVKDGSPITSVDDLADKKVGVQENTTGDLYATDDLGEDHVKRYSKGNDAVAALSSGVVDAVIIDNEPAKSYVSVNDGLKILETSYADEEYAIAINKKNTELKDQINKALKELKEDGSLDKIVEKYIPAE